MDAKRVRNRFMSFFVRLVSTFCFNRFYEPRKLLLYSPGTTLVTTILFSRTKLLTTCWEYHTPTISIVHYCNLVCHLFSMDGWAWKNLSVNPPNHGSHFIDLFQYFIPNFWKTVFQLNLRTIKNTRQVASCENIIMRQCFDDFF